MSCIFDARLPPDEPQTHALVIGVNAYPHLPGGTMEYEALAPKTFGLGQLTSPVVSAVRLAEWLLTCHNNPSARLGSLTILLSPATYTPQPAAAVKLGVVADAPLPVDEAAFDPIQTAFGLWYARLNKHQDNVGLFFFSGHGLEASDRYLLPSDFGANYMDAYDRLINFTVTHNRMDHCRAQTQCYFLDACRDRPEELVHDAATGPIGKALLGPQPGVALDRDAPIFHAAAQGSSAAGPPGEISYFTDALIQCLDGMGARDASGALCPVDHDSLGRALKELVGRMAEDNDLSLRCSVGAGETILQVPVDLHLAAAPVNVLTIVLCQPAAAHVVATLSLEDNAGEKQILVPPGRPWRLKVPAGKCIIEAGFGPTDPWNPFRLEAIASPPLFKPPIVLQARPGT